MTNEKKNDPENDAFIAAIMPAAIAAGRQFGVSPEAAILCSRFFAGPGNTVKSNPPHATYRENEAAFVELVEKGMVSREAFNKHDVWVYASSPRAAEVAGPVQAAGFRHLLGDAGGG